MSKSVKSTAKSVSSSNLGLKLNDPELAGRIIAARQAAGDFEEQAAMGRAILAGMGPEKGANRVAWVASLVFAYSESKKNAAMAGKKQCADALQGLLLSIGWHAASGKEMSKEQWEKAIEHFREGGGVYRLGEVIAAVCQAEQDGYAGI